MGEFSIVSNFNWNQDWTSFKYSPFWRRKAFDPPSAHLGHGRIHFALDSVGSGGHLFWGTGGLKDIGPPMAAGVAEW